MKLLTEIVLLSVLLYGSLQGKIIPDEYIVKLKGTSRTITEAHVQKVQSLFVNKTNFNQIRTVYSGLGNMYHAILTTELVEQVQTMTEVEYIEKDRDIKILSVQSNAPWGLARISQKSKLGSTYNYRYEADGNGVAVYVIDTSIEVDHPEFEGRAQFGARFAGENDFDEHGHGTHCAGTIGSKTYGVAKKAKLIAVKVFDASGSGTNSGIIEAIDWVVKDKRGSQGNIISMSLGGEKSKAINNAVQAAVNLNIVVIVAAGNENSDACQTSPASEPSAITVAATDVNDTRGSFSNWGSCVDVFAPGVNIISTWNNGSTNSISGTSMATPHVAGLAAYFLSQRNSSAAEITKQIISLSQSDLISQSGTDTPNLLVNNGLN